jgi:Tfp pilus assembly protein PilN
VDRKDDTLTINGQAGSINSIANYITQLKRSGYFQQVEIKESHQDTASKDVEVFIFTLTAKFGLPESAGGTGPAGAGANAAPAAGKAPARPAGKT